MLSTIMYINIYHLRFIRKQTCGNLIIYPINWNVQIIINQQLDCQDQSIAWYKYHVLLYGTLFRILNTIKHCNFQHFCIDLQYINIDFLTCVAFRYEETGRSYFKSKISNMIGSISLGLMSRRYLPWLSASSLSSFILDMREGYMSAACIKEYFDSR